LEIFEKYKEEFYNNYSSFLEILDFTVENYKNKVTVCKVHLEFKEKMNYSLTEFFIISGKYDHNADLLTQSLKIFEKYKDEFQENYTYFLEISKITSDNLEAWKHFIQIYEEIKEKTKMKAV